MRYFLWAAVIALGSVTAPGTVHAQNEQNEHKRVLVLYSTRRDAQFSIVGEEELPRMLDEGLARNLDYYAEFLDVTRFPDPAYRDAFRDFLRVKYGGIRFDLIVAMQNMAVEFMNGFGESLFDSTPVVFLSNNPRLPHPPHSTGIVQERDFASTLMLIRQLQPDVRNIFLVFGAAGTDRQYERDLQQQVQDPPAGVTYTYLSGLATAELERRLATLPEHSAVYYVLVSEDATGVRFHPLEYVDRVAAVANAPTYCWVDSAIGHGIVGGSVYSQSAAITRVAQLARRVLRSEAADAIPVAAVNLNGYQVDWRQLQRWHIDEARVPAGTVPVFRNPTTWDRYRAYIVEAATVFLAQSLLITGLLIQRQRRRRAENELRRSERELQMTAERNRDLGVRLLRAQETERSRIARELHDDICQRMLVLTIELESLQRTTADAESAAAVLAIARDVSKSLNDLSHELHPTQMRVIGLVAAIERLCTELSRAGVAVTCTHDNVPPDLQPEVMLCLFRVAQEALQNAIKYSQALHVSVEVNGQAGSITLAVSDNGVGFDVRAAWGKGVGLVSMVERVEAIGGSFDISSTTGAGTRVTATIPHPA
jgi:signal transduction histidine kinase